MPSPSCLLLQYLDPYLSIAPLAHSGAAMTLDKPFHMRSDIAFGVLLAEYYYDTGDHSALRELPVHSQWHPEHQQRPCTMPS